MKKALFFNSVAIVLIMAVGCAAPAPTEMGAVVGSYTSFNLERAARDSQRLIEKLDIDENGMPSFRRALESAQELLDTGTEGELISNSVIELMAWQYFFTPHDQHIPPIPLIKTSHKIVTPPPGVHPFYRKYVNAYEDDYTKGIVIITSDAVPDRAIRKVEQTVNKLLSARPDLRLAMSSNNIRVAIRGVAEARDNSDHPGDIGPGGARPERPTTYIEEEGVAWRDEDGEIHEGWYQLNRHVAVEEFGHSIHRSGLPFIDPEHDVIAEINAAYVNALREGTYWPPQYLDGPGLADPSMADELQMEIEALRDGEYFAVGLDCFYGVVHENSEYKLETRQQMRERDPMLYEIITRYFPTDDWSPMDYAPGIYVEPGQ
jgi:hypothetical protein|tara:strand:+ start:43 stop:1167 length:1125 start_codon:yes stop_codon:yes gene_type:complete